MKKFKVSRKASGLNFGKRKKGPETEETQKGGPIAPVQEESHHEEDSEVSGNYSHHFRIEKLVSASKDEAFDEFVQFVWNENGGIGLMSFTYIEGKESKDLSQGAKKQIFGVNQEVVKSKPGEFIVYQIKEGPFPTSDLRGDITFTQISAEVTRIKWSVDYSPQDIGILATPLGKERAEELSASMVRRVLNYVIPQMLTNLEIRIQKKKGIYSETTDHVVVAKPIDDASTRTDEQEEEDEDLEDGNVADDEVIEKRPPEKLQWAARMNTGYEGNMTRQQKRALEELKVRMSKSKWAHDIASHPDGDRWLLRFLRAECTKRKRRFRVDASEKRLLKTMEFRATYHALDKIKIPPPDFEKFEEVSAELTLVDKEGRPLVFTRAGYLANCLEVKEFTTEQWISFLVTITERRMNMCRETSKRLGHEVSATVIIYDLKGLSMASRRIIPFLKIVNAVGSAHYPEFVDRIILPNAPSVFSFLYKLVKNILDPITREKVKVYSVAETAKFHEFLRSQVDEDVLPEEYGGNSKVQVPIPLHAIQKGYNP